MMGPKVYLEDRYNHKHFKIVKYRVSIPSGCRSAETYMGSTRTC